MARNIYAPTEAECEEKLAQLIVQMKKGGLSTVSNRVCGWLCGQKPLRHVVFQVRTGAVPGDELHQCLQ